MKGDNSLPGWKLFNIQQFPNFKYIPQLSGRFPNFLVPDENFDFNQRQIEFPNIPENNTFINNINKIIIIMAILVSGSRVRFPPVSSTFPMRPSGKTPPAGKFLRK